jgi:hypothetical protein
VIPWPLYSHSCPTSSLDHQLYPLVQQVSVQVKAGVSQEWQRNAAQQLHPVGIVDLQMLNRPHL